MKRYLSSAESSKVEWLAHKIPFKSWKADPREKNIISV